MLENYNDVLSIKDLYEILPLGKNKVYNLVNDGTIKSIRVGGRIIIPKANVINFLNCSN